MCNPFFEQDEIETHTSDEEEIKPKVPARSIPITLYKDQEDRLSILAKRFAKNTGSRVNKSVAFRAMLAYVDRHWGEIEDEIIDHYRKSGPRW